jgi:prepilin-type N-terminal cleavage/methylation domain-containing protein
MTQQRGFTLIELLLSVAIISIIAGISLPVYVSFQTRNELATTTSAVVEMLRRAQNYARAGMNDSQWGVAVTASSATLFKGSSYASRDTSHDEVLTLSGSLSASGLGEVVFAKLTGMPSTTGSITLTSSTNDTDVLTLNAKGVVAY